MTMLLAVLVLVLMAGAILAVPLGLPGTWIMLALMLVLVLSGTGALSVWLVLLGAAGLVEVAEFLILRSLGTRYGASRRAFWGAVVGGFVGAVVGLPLPVIGSVVGAFLGTFVGAGVITLVETRSVSDAGRVGYGVILARTFSIVLKFGLGFAILVTAAFGVFG